MLIFIDICVLQTVFGEAKQFIGWNYENDFWLYIKYVGTLLGGVVKMTYILFGFR